MDNLVHLEIGKTDHLLSNDLPQVSLLYDYDLDQELLVIIFLVVHREFGYFWAEAEDLIELGVFAIDVLFGLLLVTLVLESNHAFAGACCLHEAIPAAYLH